MKKGLSKLSTNEPENILKKEGRGYKDFKKVGGELSQEVGALKRRGLEGFV